MQGKNDSFLTLRLGAHGSADSLDMKPKPPDPFRRANAPVLKRKEESLIKAPPTKKPPTLR